MNENLRIGLLAIVLTRLAVDVMLASLLVVLAVWSIFDWTANPAVLASRLVDWTVRSLVDWTAMPGVLLYGGELVIVAPVSALLYLRWFSPMFA